MMLSRRKLLPALMWAGIALVLLLNLNRLRLDPTGAAVSGDPETGNASIRQTTDPWAANDAPVLITEFLASNRTDFVDEDGDPSDWIELYNRSDYAVNLFGWSLTDDPSRPDKWRFDEFIMQPGQYLVVFASGKDRFLPNGGGDGGTEGNGQGVSVPLFHTNFALNSNPAYLALHPPTARRYLDGSLFDYPEQMPNVSFGLVVDGGGGVTRASVYFDVPTPGAANHTGSAWAQVTAPVRASAPAGFYTDPVQVALRASGGEIRFTTDGSLPSLEHGNVYAGPIAIGQTTVLRAAVVREGFETGPVLTQSYLFVDDVMRQPPDPAGFPTTWGIHDSSLGGYEAGTEREAIYGMDPRIVEHPDYGPQVHTGLLDLPTLSLVMPMSSLDIYAATHDRGREAERAVSVEFFYPTDTDRNLQVDAGVRIHGGAGRWSFMPKQSLRLYFRSEYGATRLQHPVFSDSPVVEFNQLVLRAGTDRSFVGHPPTPENPHIDHRLTTYTRDEWARKSQLAMSGIGAHGRFVHLYLNGAYWGLYNLVERLDTDFAAANLGGDVEEWFSVTQGGMRPGMPDRFLVMLDLAQAGHLADPARYATMLEFVDPIQFSDYVILQWYMGNRDWPENNWTVNVQYPAGRNLFFVWDAEDTWNDGAALRLGVDQVEGAPFPNVVKLVFEALWENPDFRVVFADRFYAHLHNDGVLTDANAQARWQSLNAEIEEAIAAESARWGGVRYAEPITPDDWAHARDLVLAQMDGNGARLIELARAAGYYPLLDAPVMSQPGGEFDQTLALRLDAGAEEGTGDAGIYYTLDGSDPRRAGTGAIASAAQRYAGAIDLVEATVVTARTLTGTPDAPVWSAANVAHFWRAGQVGDVRITEIMYNPVGGGDFEFVEIMNIGELPVDLSGAFFEGITFRFAEYRSMAAGERMVLVRDFSAFRSRYPEAPIHGVFAGRLSNQGEYLALRTRTGAVLDALTYGVDERWPISAGGAGDSLTRHSLVDDPSLPQSWRASTLIHGSPGAPDGTQVAGPETPDALSASDTEEGGE